MLQSLKQDFFYLVLVWILQEDLPRRSQNGIRCGKNLLGEVTERRRAGSQRKWVRLQAVMLP